MIKNSSSDVRGIGDSLPLETTKEERAAFFSSPIWKDISATLEAWLVDTRDFLEDPDGDLSEGETSRARGRAQTLRAVINLRDYLT